VAGKGWPHKVCQSAWHLCLRYGIKSDLDHMIWEQGMLLSPEASDTISGGAFGLLGSREADIARKVKQNTSDLQPHPKLSAMNMPDEDVFFD
jgi:hypothetical protein